MSTDVREIGKTRSQRINLDYHRHKTWLTRSRGWLALLALLAAGGYCFYVYGANAAPHLSTGRVAMPHAAFENNCHACHVDFTPISADALQLTSSEALRRLENACQVCHPVKQHFRSSMAMSEKFSTTDQHCSGCHADHLGRNHDMVNISSEQCTQCHGDLKVARNVDNLPQIKQVAVTQFTAENHGNFASLGFGNDDSQGRTDPGRIKFNHQQHMLPGMAIPDVGVEFTYGMLEANLSQHYARPSGDKSIVDKMPVQLSCRDCHDYSGALGGSAVGDTEVGRQMAPISFDQHCAACHSMNAPGRSDGDLPLPHAAPWTEVDKLLAAKLVGGQWLGSIRTPRDAVRNTPRADEGKLAAMVNSETLPRDVGKARELVNAAVEAAHAATRARCVECHDEKDIEDASIDRLRSGMDPPLIPSRWLVRGIYDHSAHRDIDCKFCHELPQDELGPQTQFEDKSALIMIGGIETCVGCHRDANAPMDSSFNVPLSPDATEAANTITSNSGDKRQWWASAACIECHRYHLQRPPMASGDLAITMAEALTP